MGERTTDLSLWLGASASLGGVPPPPRVRFSPAASPRAEGAVEYVLSETVLGDMAMHWTAHWLRGFFCVTDLPREWVQMIRDTIRGPVYEGRWVGDVGADEEAGERVALPGTLLALPAGEGEGNSI